MMIRNGEELPKELRKLQVEMGIEPFLDCGAISSASAVNFLSADEKARETSRAR
jgi:hypothetical protein